MPDTRIKTFYGLADANNFYVSCERLFRPDLNGKPVVVLSNNDGCVISRSNEAKEFIPMGAPAFQYEKIFKEKKVEVFSANFTLYGDLSTRMMNLIARHVPDMEIYSIDEAFLKFPGFDANFLDEHMRNMKREIFKGIGIPLTIGLAPTKTLAKVAARIAKKFPEKTGGVYILDTQEKINKALRWLPVEDIHGIGRRIASKLKKEKILKASDFIQLPDAWLRKRFSVQAVRIKHELLEIPVFDLEMPQPRKRIATTRTFETNIENFEEIRERIVTFASVTAAKLRRQSLACRFVTVFIKTNRHRSDMPQYFGSITLRTDHPVNSSLELAKWAVRGLEKIWKTGYAYKKAGILVGELVPQSQKQLNLFVSPDERHEKLMQVVDHLNKHYGYDLLKTGGQDPQRTWKMKQTKLSPAYTTRLSDIIKVKVE